MKYFFFFFIPLFYFIFFLLYTIVFIIIKNVFSLFRFRLNYLGKWGACNATCSTKFGVKKREVICKDRTTNVETGNCIPERRPLDTRRCHYKRQCGDEKPGRIKKKFLMSTENYILITIINKLKNNSYFYYFNYIYLYIFIFMCVLIFLFFCFQ